MRETGQHPNLIVDKHRRWRGQLRAAARAVVTSRTHGELGAAGAMLATAEEGVGLYQ